MNCMGNVLLLVFISCYYKKDQVNKLNHYFCNLIIASKNSLMQLIL